jgi:hypothetical protein
VTVKQRFDPTTHYAIEDTPSRADTSHVRRKFLDIPYGGLSPSQKLDVYLPDEGVGPFPVIVSIHGGAFMGCEKSDMQILPMLEGLKQGYAVVAVNYRLSWEAVFPAPVHDVTAKSRARCACYRLPFCVPSVLALSKPPSREPRLRRRAHQCVDAYDAAGAPSSAGSGWRPGT